MRCERRSWRFGCGTSGGKGKNGDFQICFWLRCRGFLTILARNSRKDSKARSAANQPLPCDWRLCKRGLVIERWLPTRFAQALMTNQASRIKRAISATTRFPAPLYQNPFHPAPRASCIFVGVTRKSVGTTDTKKERRPQWELTGWSKNCTDVKPHTSTLLAPWGFLGKQATQRSTLRLIPVHTGHNKRQKGVCIAQMIVWFSPVPIHAAHASLWTTVSSITLPLRCIAR